MSGPFVTADVVAVEEVCPGVRSVLLRPDDGVRRHPTGSSLDISVVAGGLTDTRSYSVVGETPSDGCYRIAVKLLDESRGGSRWVHRLVPGDRVQITHPASHFELRFGRAHYTLVAGGIGVTPLIGMAEALTARGIPVRFLYIGHGRSRLPFVDRLSTLLGDSLTVHETSTDGRPDLAGVVAGVPADGEVYVCGPLGLMDDLRQEWSRAGRPADRLRLETFGTGGRFPTAPFDVVVNDQGTRVHVPADQSMLQAMITARVEIMWDCLRGECGLCLVTVLDSDADLDHRDVFLSDAQRAAGDRLAACVSRASGGTVRVDAGFRPA